MAFSGRDPRAPLLVGEVYCILSVGILRLIMEWRIWTGASIPMGQGGACPPNIYEGGDIHGNVPPNILEVMSFRMSTRVTATVVCCILTQILCVI